MISLPKLNLVRLLDPLYLLQYVFLKGVVGLLLCLDFLRLVLLFSLLHLFHTLVTGGLLSE